MKYVRAFFKNNGVQSPLSSILCVIIGVLLGYVALLIINAEGAWEAITHVMMNFFTWP